MDVPFMFFIGVSALWAIASIAFSAFMCVSLINDERRRARNDQISASYGEPVAVMLRKFIPMALVLIPLTSLVAGALAYAVTLAVQWMGQNLSLLPTLVTVAMVLMVGFSRRREIVTA